MPGAHTTAHLRRDRSTSHSVFFFFFARCSERGERPHQPAAPNEEGSRAARRKKSTPHPVFTFAIRRSERGGRPRQPAGKGPPQPESYPPSPPAIPNAQGRCGTIPYASPGPSATPAPSTPPGSLLYIKESRTAAPPPSSFPRSSDQLPAIAPAGIGVAQTGIPVIPRSAQSAIFAPSDPSPDIRIPWQTSSNA